MKIIYVAGPYRAETENGVFENIIHARRVAQRLWHEGFAVICPHLNSAYMGDKQNDTVFLKGDIEILARCDAIYMLTGWMYSEGATVELELAESLDLEVVYE